MFELGFLLVFENIENNYIIFIGNHIKTSIDGL